MTRDLRELFEITLQGMTRDLNGSEFGFKALATAASQEWSEECCLAMDKITVDMMKLGSQKGGYFLQSNNDGGR